MRTQTEILFRKAIELARQSQKGQVILLVLPTDAWEEEEFDRPWKKTFLDWLRKGRTVAVAAELSAVSPRHAFRSYHEDPDFAEAWDAIRSSRRDVPRVTSDSPRRKNDE